MLSDSSCSSSDRSFKFPFDTTDALSIHELAVKDLPKPDAENPFSVAMHSPPGNYLGEFNMATSTFAPIVLKFPNIILKLFHFFESV